ncbi:MAG: iron-sulfur cluster carrier protein ApbC [Gammaproteobacteria bacterium]|nr:iron-sulfur cluster carrier protein ApbC [Gammaproteobacteria bacterium]
MTAARETQIRQALDAYVDPYLGCSLAAAGALEAVEVGDDRVRLEVRLGFPAAGHRAALEAAIRERLAGVADSVDIDVGWRIASHAVQRNLKPIGRIRNIIAVASGKGGVGKSTTAVNLALALTAEGACAGLLDADIYGPSQPRMLGIAGERPVSTDGKRLEPLVAHGIECMSIGFLIDEEQPMVWRGPMVTQALNQLVHETNWGELDYLIVDMPPGTGDTQLTLAQSVPVSGAIIVTTPQDIALLDARKGLKMFEKVGVQVLGIIENMSTHICSRCGHEEPIFGTGGGQRMAEQYNVPLLGALPLDIGIREQADNGRPSVVADPEGAPALAYRDIARRAAARLSLSGRDYSRLFPKISVENT